MAASSILLYLLKANGALLLCAAAYYGLLRRLTFFQLNRAYLVLALLFAAVYPALPVPALLPAEATPAVLISVAGNAAALPAAAAAPSGPGIDWAAVGVALYGAGAAVLLARLLVQLLALARLRARSRPAVLAGLPVRTLPGSISPFSFAGSIYLNPDQHPGPELAAVLRHEQVHVRQAHTLDVLLAQLALAAAWCNPAAWLLRRALLDNLEFLADAAVLATGLDRRAYQYSLLRLSTAPAGPALVSHFTFPTLKNRVVMMNTPLSSSGQMARYFVAGPLTLALALGISGARAQSGGPVGPPAATQQSRVEPLKLVDNAGATRLVLAGPADYYLDAKKSNAAALAQLNPADIASVSLLKAEQARTLFGNALPAYLITTKKQQNDQAVVAFNKQAERLMPLRMGFDAALNPELKQLPGPASATVGAAEHPLPASITAYIAQTYPGSTVDSYFVSERAGAKPPHIQYYASITERGGEKHKLYFDAAGRPVAGPAPAAGKALNTHPLVYLDGQRYTGNINDIGPDNIANISVFKGDKAVQRFGNSAADGVLVVTTKTHENDAQVRAFNGQAEAAMADPASAAATPAPAAASVPYLAAPALAYLTQHYPAARLLGVAAVPATQGGPIRYQAQVAIGKRPAYLLFDSAGQFISESSTSYLK